MADKRLRLLIEEAKHSTVVYMVWVSDPVLRQKYLLKWVDVAEGLVNNDKQDINDIILIPFDMIYKVVRDQLLSHDGHSIFLLVENAYNKRIKDVFQEKSEKIKALNIGIKFLIDKNVGLSLIVDRDRKND